jgi:hypothetical protein
MLRILNDGSLGAPTELPLDAMNVVEPHPVGRVQAQSAAEPTLFDTQHIQLGSVVADIDAEMSSAVAWGLPLVVGGATLLAQGTMFGSQICLGLGAACILSVVLLQSRARRRVRRTIIDTALFQGFPEQLARRRASEYLNSWSR